ncbi:MAG: replicative DNA helicase [Cellvibrionaceae bacterium]
MNELAPEVSIDKPKRPAAPLPHSIEAEQAVLGGLMLADKQFDAVAEILAPADFYSADHRLIFEVMAQLSGEEKPLDLITLEGALDNKGVLQQVGGLAYIGDIARNTPSAANLLSYAQAVKERSTIRSLIRAAGDISQSGFNPDGRSADHLIEQAERAIQTIAEGRPKDGGFFGVNDLLKQAVDRIDLLFQSGGSITGLDSGFSDLNEKTSGWQNSDLIILAARPSMGKTALAMNFVEHAVLNQDRPVLVFSMEMPADGLMMRMLASIGRIEASRIRDGQLNEEDWSRLNTAVRKLQNRPLFIDDTAALTPQELRARVKRKVSDFRHQVEEKLKAEGQNPTPEQLDELSRPAMIMIDYLQLMQTAGPSEGRTQEISEISRSLKTIAKEYSTPMIALSQLSRAVEQRPNKRPMNSDLRESGAIEQDADLIVFIYRDEYYNKEDSKDPGVAEIIIGKNRNGEVGTSKLAFVGKFAKFENLAPDYMGGMGE